MNCSIGQSWYQVRIPSKMAVHAKQGMDIHGYPLILNQVSDPVIQVPDPIFWQVSDPGPSFRSKFLIPPLPRIPWGASGTPMGFLIGILWKPSVSRNLVFFQGFRPVFHVFRGRGGSGRVREPVFHTQESISHHKIKPWTSQKFEFLYDRKVVINQYVLDLL